MPPQQFLEWANRDGKKPEMNDWYTRNACGLLKLFEKRFGAVD
jgi:hypothetical protein